MTAVPLILMYHSVARCSADPYGVTVSPERFAAQLRWLAERGLRGVSVRDLLAAGPADGLVGLTFDDGYADFADEAVPVLLRFGFTATVFVVAGQLGGHNAWDPGGPRKPLMDVGQVCAVARQGMEIGSHAVRHVPLTRLDGRALRHEAATSRERLEDVLGMPVTGFAYPYGHAGSREVAAVGEAGYGYGCATGRPPHAGVHALPRTYVGDRDGPLRLRAKQARHRLRWSRGAGSRGVS